MLKYINDVMINIKFLIIIIDTITLYKCKCMLMII